MSDRQIAKALGVSHSTVRDIREEMTLSNNSDNDGLSRSKNSDDFRIGADGKRYSRRPVSVFNPTKREEKAMKKPECSISFLEFLPSLGAWPPITTQGS